MYSEWVKPYVWRKDVVEWFNSRPQIIQDLVLKFPPDCKVRCTRRLLIPEPGTLGIVCSYTEDGCVSVLSPERGVRAFCHPDDLEVVSYRKGLTPEDIREQCFL